MRNGDSYGVTHVFEAVAGHSKSLGLNVIKYELTSYLYINDS
jgi:hypothetical protein